MPHQVAALERLKKTGGCQLLNMPPGSGKSLVALSYMSRLPPGSRTLILAPVTLLETWAQEAMKWFGWELTLVRGTGGKRAALYDEPICVVGYETFRRDYDIILRKGWNLLVCDESHKVKSPKSFVTKRAKLLAARTPRRILMSGTPLVNSWADMWSQCEMVSPGCLYGNFFTFRNIHAIMPIPGVPMIKGWRMVEEIQRRIAPHVFSVDKDEVQSALPPVTITDVPVTLTTKERKAYEQMRDEFLLEMEGVELTIANALVKAGRLRQCVNGVEVFGIEDDGSKLRALKELLEMIGQEHVIVFSMYAKTIESYASKLGVSSVITGDTRFRDDVIQTWKRQGGPLLMTAAGEAGLNLQEARYVINIELPWTQASYEQRVGRAWRTGQKRPVTVYNLMAKDTIDYGVKKLLEKKGDMMESLSDLV